MVEKRSVKYIYVAFFLMLSLIVLLPITVMVSGFFGISTRAHETLITPLGWFLIPFEGLDSVFAKIIAILIGVISLSIFILGNVGLIRQVQERCFSPMLLIVTLVSGVPLIVLLSILF